MMLKTLVTAALLTTLAATCAIAAEGEKGTSTKMLYHVVSVKFKADADPKKVKDAEAAFEGLKDKIPTITSLHWGTNVSPEKRNKGFTHCFVLTFTSEKDRDAYLVDPAHKALGGVLGPVMDDVMVVDFWSQN